MRKKHLKTPAEERLWKEITWEFMSEESCVEDDNMINKHPVPFRSEGSHYSFNDVCLSCTSCILIALNELILKLDKRAAKKEAPKFGFKKKVRIVKSPSKLPCPREAPKWAIVQCADHNETSTSGISLTTAMDSTSNNSDSDSYDSDSD